MKPHLLAVMLYLFIFGIFMWLVVLVAVVFGGDPAPTRLAVLTDVANPVRWPGVPADAYATVAALTPDAIVTLGDFPHYNPAGRATTRNQFRAKFRRMTALARTCAEPALAPAGCQYEALIAPLRVLPTWDDHDSTQNNSDRTRRFMSLAVREFKRAHPAVYPGAGIWRSERVSGHAEVFLLDVRSQRDPNGTDGQMLGPDQEAWLIAGVRESTAPWKILASSVPWNPSVRKKADSWSGFPTAAARLVLALHDVPGIVWVTGDIHSGGAIHRDDLGWAELNAPHTNLNPEFTNTCQPPIVKPSQDPTASCGIWSHGYLSGEVGGGLGWLEATETTLTLQARAVDGTVRLTLEVGR